MRRYLVTGAAGFIGSHLAAALVARGDTVKGIDSFTDYYDRSIKELNVASLRQANRFELEERDVLELSTTDLESTDGVFHFAARAGVRGSWGQSFDRYLTANVLATKHVFELAAGLGIRVVFASSSSVYGNAERLPTSEHDVARPLSPYGVTKLACEHLAAAYGDQRMLDVITLRYSTVYGPRQRPDMAFTRVARALQDGSTFTIFGDGAQSRDVTYVLDAVSAALLAMERGESGRAYNVGSGHQATLFEAIQLFESQARRPLPIDFRPAAPGDVRHTGSDTSLSQRDLGWSPAYALDAGIAAQWEWAQSTIARRDER